MTHLSSSGANAPPHSSFDTGRAVSIFMYSQSMLLLYWMSTEGGRKEGHTYYFIYLDWSEKVIFWPHFCMKEKKWFAILRYHVLWSWSGKWRLPKNIFTQWRQGYIIQLNSASYKKIRIQCWEKHGNTMNIDHLKFGIAYWQIK